MGSWSCLRDQDYRMRLGRPRKRRDSSCLPRLFRLWPGCEVRNLLYQACRWRGRSQSLILSVLVCMLSTLQCMPVRLLPCHTCVLLRDPSYGYIHIYRERLPRRTLDPSVRSSIPTAFVAWPPRGGLQSMIKKANNLITQGCKTDRSTRRMSSLDTAANSHPRPS